MAFCWQPINVLWFLEPETALVMSFVMHCYLLLLRRLRTCWQRFPEYRILGCVHVETCQLCIKAQYHGNLDSFVFRVLVKWCYIFKFCFGCLRMEHLFISIKFVIVLKLKQVFLPEKSWTSNFFFIFSSNGWVSLSL